MRGPVCAQDFYNLVDVYLDAVLFPNCVRDEQTFQQEGWHYELDKPDEDITFKGTPRTLKLVASGLLGTWDGASMRAITQAI